MRLGTTPVLVDVIWLTERPLSVRIDSESKDAGNRLRPAIRQLERLGLVVVHPLASRLVSWDSNMNPLVRRLRGRFEGKIFGKRYS